MNTIPTFETDDPDVTAMGAFFSAFQSGGVEGAVLALQQSIEPDSTDFGRLVDRCCRLIEAIQADAALSSIVRATAAFAEKVALIAAQSRHTRETGRDGAGKGAARDMGASKAVVVTKPLPPSSAVGRFLSASPTEHASPPPPTTLEVNDVGGDVRGLLAMLPHNSLLPHVYEDLIASYPSVVKKIRHGSRGNAVLFLLTKFARSRILSVDDLVFGLRQMRIFEDDTSVEEAERAVAWEVNNLIRSGWPIRRFPRRGYQFEPAEETAM